ncbi:MAG: PilZ domain-containing protein [Desulfocapsaceae bacterium]
MQNREYPRLEIPQIQADVSDGKGFFTGAVKNLSRFGLSISDIPTNLDNSSDIYSVILDGPGTHFKLLVRPIWEQDDGNSKTIGARIENSPWTWTEFVMRQETLANELTA